ncbi:MAG: glycerol-3-phosphate acyltransferase, partial [Spirochaetaceae bacterium]|nr:glycerol-3-phosphate acyltransferase [Spirochaetaceae bacterium]
IKAAAAVTIAYLFGSVNFAIIFTRLVSGEDIRTLGNKNPGASNMGRVVGSGWGILVLILDALKAIIVILPARLWLFNQGTSIDYGVLYLMGIVAVLGHIFPIWYHFKGGGGVSTMLAVSLWFVPLEFTISILSGGLLALTFMRKKGNWLTQWSPIFFITLTPFLTMILNFFVDIPVWKGISLGGHPWTVVIGCFTLSLMMLGLNYRLVKAKATGDNWEKHKTV